MMTEPTQSFLKDKDREQLAAHFENLQNPVTLLFFTQEMECQFCSETRKILSEVSDLSSLIKVSVYDFEKDAAKASQLGIDKIPATAILGTFEDRREKDFGVRFFGIPSGYEFTPLIMDITAISSGSSTLQPSTKEKVHALKKDVHIQVFTTLTCPYCAKAVTTAHQIAIESDLIKADMVESVEFPHLARKYDVFAVPKVVINETHTFEGVVPEEKFVEEIVKATQ